MPKIKKSTHIVPKLRRASGWSTSDADEIERRRLRGQNESCEVEALTSVKGFYGAYRLTSATGRSYRVEIRSLSENVNSCECPDHRINGLGTCKHIEATLCRLQYRRKRAFREAADRGSPYIEIYLDRRDNRVKICWPHGSRSRSKARVLLSAFFNDKNLLDGKPLDTIPALQRAILAAQPALRRKVRVSLELNAWLETIDRREQQIRDRRHFETEVAAGKASLDLLRHPLYPYQQEGMLHLAFSGRALLADEMGLGKTVQAIAACELLRRRRGIQRVLVICPASLKGEWYDQITKFSDLPTQTVLGSRAARLRQYATHSFFSLANYEQMRPDVEAINTILKPDVIILDEAQRIKNWQTKTAIAIKQLHSAYSFVLTGTPVENRIDEIYSIVQFLDPWIFGPLFRFNREFYQLDDKGRASGYRNLDQLYERLQPVMLRRRKQEVEGQLPGRTVNTYFVPMHKEQMLRYGEYDLRVTRIAAMARKRPLSKEEMQQLQRNLACMRMLCDTPYILDQDCRISPKLEELNKILQEILQSGDHKILIFSEWERMLQLVMQQAQSMRLGYALHTGKIPQLKRREEIRRFKNDPDCRLLLSTDSGSVGLNLQVADIVINLDMPWNPAKLEQRIARVWRKHQRRSVQVINLVSENSIEHRMLDLLEQKRALFEKVVEGKGKKAMSLPSGRAVFLQQIEALVSVQTATSHMPPADPPPADPLERLRDKILCHCDDQLHRMELYDDGERQTLLLVVERPDDALQGLLNQQLHDLFPGQTPQLKLLNPESFAALQQLIDAGILKTNQVPTRILFPAPAQDSQQQNRDSIRLREALEHLTASERRHRMAKVLAEGGFAQEALEPVRDAVEIALQALMIWQGKPIDGVPELGLIDTTLVATHILPATTLPLIAQLREQPAELDAAQAGTLYKLADALYLRMSSVLKVAAQS